MDYRSVGVDILEGDKLVGWLKNHLKPFSNSKVIAGIGSYSGLFKAEFSRMKEPCLAGSTDGVGTKLKLAVHFQRYKEVAQDLVAMCANDLICSGARPLFFMDYYACSKLRQKPAREFLSGLQKACRKSHLVLLGGETAEMPDCYKGFDFDCAGFAVGLVDKSQILGSHKVRVGDVLIGIPSSGFHSNGFSLLRKIFQKDLWKWEEDLLTPTALYTSLALDLFKIEGLKAIAHITGGGMDNVNRILPPGTKAELSLWKLPPSILEVQKRASLSLRDLMKTFNCGIGLVLAVSPRSIKWIEQVIIRHNQTCVRLGVVKAQKNLKTPSWVLNI